MNTFIQTLNDWGENFLSCAWPMLWQSSLLIAIIFAFDVLFARRVRAAVRYALWLAVLVKLLLPPTLALPTSAAWWLWPAKPPLTPLINSQVVTYDAPITLSSTSIPQTIPYVPPPPKLSGAGWTILAVGTMDVALLLWLAVRWLRVAAKVRRVMPLGNQGLVPRPETARPHPGPLPQERENHPPMVWNDERESRFNISTRATEIIETLQEVCQLARLRRCPRLKLVEGDQSPAVYGLFRPVILLPRALAEQLSVRQLRAVLLHEAMHLRRRDVWLNCAQTLLQIAYWWHPLLWLANTRIRRLREEAVDDAVMLALRGDADAYAPTLLAVAKFSFRRTLSGLALVGILESRSKLRRRIERLVDYRPPRRAGLTVLSLCGIVAFSAVALPMGQGTLETEPTTQVADLSGTTTGGGLVDYLGSANTPAVNTNVKIVGGLAKNHWPDPNFEGIRNVNLTARFLILSDDQLKAAAPELLESPDPLLLSSHATAELLRHLQEGGARYFNEDWSNGIVQPPVSGGRQDYEIGGRTDGIGMITALTTNLGGAFSNILFLYGYRIQMPATQPDWTAMNFALRPLIQDGGTYCQMDLSFPEAGTPNWHSEITIPDGDAMVWFAISPGAPGKYQVALLTPTLDKQNAGGPLSDDSLTKTLRDAGMLPPGFVVHLKGPPVATSPSRKMIYDKLTHIHADAPPYQELPLSEVIRFLRMQSQLHDPDKVGINFNFNPGGGGGPQIDPSTGLPVTAPANAPLTDPTQINVTLEATNLSLLDLLNAIVVNSDHPIEYSVQDYGVVFSAKVPDAPLYELREFKIEPKVYANLQKIMNIPPAKPPPLAQSSNGGLYVEPSEPIDISRAFKQYFLRFGIKLDSPEQVYFNDRLSILFVYATPKDLDVVERAIGTLIQRPTLNQAASNGTGAGISGQTESALNQALVAERLAAHMEMTAQADPQPTNSIDATNTLEMRTFKVNTNVFFVDLAKLTGQQVLASDINISKVLKQLFEKRDVDLSPPKQVYFNSHLGILFVYAMKDDLDVIERIVAMLDDSHWSDAQMKNLTNETAHPLMPFPKIRVSVVNDPVTDSQIFGSFASTSVNSDGLKTKTFFVGTAAFSAAVREKTGETNEYIGFRELAAQAGVDLSPPKQIYFTHNIGALHVSATTNDLMAIAAILTDLHCPPPMVHVKARFIEVPKSFFADAQNYIPAGVTNGVGVLPNPDFQVLLHEIGQQKGSEELAEPEVTTICGRQTEMRATIIQPVVTNYFVNMHPTNSADNITPQIGQIETGPILDVVPMGLQDGYTLDLQVVPSLIEFLGYADTEGLPKRTVTDSRGAKFELPNVLPLFKVYETNMQITLYDGQTLVLAPTVKQVSAGMNDEKWRDRIADFFGESKKEEDKVLLVLVTATFIDAAGNRLHSDREMLFAQDHVPPQDSSSHPGLYHYPSQTLPFR